YKKGRGFVNIVVAEGARSKAGTVTSREGEKGSEHVRLVGVAYALAQQLKAAGCRAEIRETVLGHVQRGGSPVAFDRVLASLMGVKAFEMALAKDFGKMVSFVNNAVTTVTLEEATREHRLVDTHSQLVNAARGLGISFGD
ncbi:MAG TPA: 6-phosphofructokinase, partial [Chryseosolibacter sp.]|nr:6-phosphofructokinase [Chryseosolibacter sp.]